jgi:hypothetical protein
MRNLSLISVPRRFPRNESAPPRRRSRRTAGELLAAGDCIGLPPVQVDRFGGGSWKRSKDEEKSVGEKKSLTSLLFPQSILKLAPPTATWVDTGQSSKEGKYLKKTTVESKM